MVGAGDAEPVADVVEPAVDGERRRGEDRRPHAVEQELAHNFGDVNRRGAQKDAAAAKLDEVHVVGIARTQEKPQLVAQPAGAAC